MTLDSAISALHRELDQALDDTSTPHWRWRIRQQLSVIRDALADQQAASRDGWLSARLTGSERNRSQLQARTSVLGRRILAMADPDTALGELRRLLADLEHYRQRLHDLAYDSVALELGGSE